jgi:hypothetical protein
MAKRCLNPSTGSGQRWMKQVVLFVFLLYAGEEDPLCLSTALIPSISVLMSGKWEEREEIRVRTQPLKYILKNFKRGFNGDYQVNLTPNKLRTFCEIDWSAFDVGWPLEGH